MLWTVAIVGEARQRPFHGHWQLPQVRKEAELWFLGAPTQVVDDVSWEAEERLGGTHPRSGQVGA